MNTAEYLDFHARGVGRLLGVRFASAAPDRVVAEMPVSRLHFTRDGTVHGGVIMALADSAGGYGAVLNLPPDHYTATIESKTNFLGQGSGDLLVGEATPLHVGRTISVWRTRVLRGGDACIAEVTQTQIVLPERQADDAAGATDREITEPPIETISDERRRQIFEGACEVIAQKGFAKATIREIAAASGMPVPTMYQYIDSKEDLLSLIYDSFMGDINARLRASVADGHKPTQNLINAIDADIKSNDAYHAYIKLMFQETRALNADGRRRVDELDGAHVAILRGILEEGVATGEFDIDDVELAANYIFFLCAVWPLRHWSIGDHGVETVTENMSRFVLRAVGAEEMTAKTKVA